MQLSQNRYTMSSCILLLNSVKNQGVANSSGFILCEVKKLAKRGSKYLINSFKIENYAYKVRNSRSLNIVGKQLPTNPLKYRQTSSIVNPSLLKSKNGATTSFRPCLYHTFSVLQYSVNIRSIKSFSSDVRIKFRVRSTSVLMTR